MISLHVVGYVVAIQLGQIRHPAQRCIIIQTIREMIRCQNDNGIIRDSGLLQVVHQVRQSIFQLQVRCDISLNRFGVRHILNL